MYAEALQHHAWEHAAAGTTEQAEQYVWRTLQLLDRAVVQYHGADIFIDMVRRHIQEGRTAMTQSDLLGAMLALLTGLKVLQQAEHEPQTQVENGPPSQTHTRV
jgi:hypothetical protein